MERATLFYFVFVFLKNIIQNELFSPFLYFKAIIRIRIYIIIVILIDNRIIEYKYYNYYITHISIPIY